MIRKTFTQKDVNNIIRNRVERINARMEQLENDNALLRFELNELKEYESDGTEARETQTSSEKETRKLWME